MTLAEPASVRALAEAFAEGVLTRSPETATWLGDRRFDDRLSDLGPVGREAEGTALEGLRTALACMDAPAPDGEDAITREMLELAVRDGLAALDRRLYHLALDQMGGPQVSLAMLLNWHTLETEEHARTLLARFGGFPRYVDQYVGNLAEGAACGRTSPRVALERVVAQLRALLETAPEASPYGQAAEKAPAAWRGRLLAGVRDSVYPAFQRLLTYLETEYAPLARETPGLWAIPDGEATYRELVRRVIQSDLGPEEVHRIGLEELRGIREEMRALGVRDVRAHAEALKADPGNHFATREALLAGARGIYERALAALPRLFGRLPATPCRVLPIEEYRERDSVAAFYYAPSQDGSRPGTFYVNTHGPETRPRYNLPALTAHEAVPGHHLQIALGYEARDLPRFRRHGLGVDEALTAFVEGWGLYAERLGAELGLYGTDRERFGMLSYQAWRATRLVVDTGLHALRWPRDRAIRFLLDEVGLPEPEVVNEVDRYIVWPGQALAYKFGQRHLEGLRRRARDALGPRFDARAFHDELLRHGALPLSTATAVVEHWLETVSSRATE